MSAAVTERSIRVGERSLAMSSSTTLDNPAGVPRGASERRARTAAGRWPRWRAGKMRPKILLWALGVPIPIIIVIFLIRGCM